MNKTVITEQLLQAIWKCETALALRNDPYLVGNGDTLKTNIAQAMRAFSGSWIGYHAYVYYRDLNDPEPGDHFSSEWGLMNGFMSIPMSGNWHEYPPDAIRDVIFEGVDTNYETRMADASDKAKAALEENYETVRTILDALNAKPKAPALDRIGEEIGKIVVRMNASNVIEVMRPRGQFMSRDSLAMSQGFRTPPHIMVNAEEIARLHPFSALESLVGCAKKILKYMEINDLIERKTMPSGQKVFIGHGRSLVWRELKDFISDRLHLDWEEFNREPTAGISTTERLQTMLDSACVAFIIMTAEDQHADKSLHARENVIHEVGLFQGRLGFRRSLVLLEQGCTEFSNISGLSQIRFPAENISACFEEVRRVLEREGIV
ncbi:MAG: nucleotide-binding protein [Kiritimatiellae bacterium]|nr:nucleotide-binding protein [Kiritimatiellia bacterium]MCO5061798.1 nucleotide-binding protein [Kiritimatiellia bacterium]MCO5067428.1 nucleotide-binding protein [Kiritimatiellia bacterium]